MKPINKTLVFTAAAMMIMPAFANANEASETNVRSNFAPVTSQPVRSFNSFDGTQAGVNVPHLLKRTIANYEAGDYHMASILAHRLLRSNSRNALGHYYLGLTKQKQGNMRKAERHLKIANQTFANAPQSYAALGQVYVENGKPEKAQKLLGKLDRLTNANQAEVDMAKNIIKTALAQ